MNSVRHLSCWKLSLPFSFALWVAVPFSTQAATHNINSPQTLAAASRIAKPGDVLVLQNREWRDADLVFEASGAADKPITLRAQTPGKVVLTGKSRLRFGGRHLVVEGIWFRDCAGAGDTVEFRRDSKTPAEFSRLTQCAITQSAGSQQNQECRWVSLHGLSNRVDHCYFAGKTSPGTTLVVWVGPAPNYHRIDANHFGPRPRLGKNGGETIRIGTSDVSLSNSRSLVEGNLFQECNGEVEIVSNKSCENIYRYNTFQRCEGAMTFRHGNRCRVEGNFFLGENSRNTGGVRVIGEDHVVVNNYFSDLAGEESRSPLTFMNGIPNSVLHGYFQVKRATIAFNTFVNCKSGWVLGVRGEQTATLPPEDCVFAYNVIANGNGPTLLSSPVRAVWQGNLFQKGAAMPGVQIADPKLKPDSQRLWRPSPESPALAIAPAFKGVTDDIDGHPRSGKLDAGCDQHSTAPPLRRPLLPAGVGPAWFPR